MQIDIIKLNSSIHKIASVGVGVSIKTQLEPLYVMITVIKITRQIYSRDQYCN